MWPWRCYFLSWSQEKFAFHTMVTENMFCFATQNIRRNCVQNTMQMRLPGRKKITTNYWRVFLEKMNRNITTTWRTAPNLARQNFFCKHHTHNSLFWSRHLPLEFVLHVGFTFLHDDNISNSRPFIKI